MDKEQKYDISDRYGAIMLFKAIKQSCEDSMNNPTQKFMQNTLIILKKCDILLSCVKIQYFTGDLL